MPYLDITTIYDVQD